MAGLTLARGGCKDYLRVFHQEKELAAERLPVVAVPTTARSVAVVCVCVCCVMERI